MNNLWLQSFQADCSINVGDKKGYIFFRRACRKAFNAEREREKKQPIIQGYMNAFAKSAPWLSIDSAALL